MKYIIIRELGIEGPIMFPDFIQHSDAVNPKTKKPVSAGFFDRDASGQVVTHGESISLGLKPRKQDATLIQIALTHAN